MIHRLGRGLGAGGDTHAGAGGWATILNSES